MDVATAESAKRNLNGREYNGRNLRVDFADAADREAFAKKAGGAGGGGGAPISYDAPIGGAHTASAGAQMSAAGMGQGGGMDQITNRLSEMSPAQLFSVMNQLKQLIGQDQTGARQLLVQNPRQDGRHAWRPTPRKSAAPEKELVQQSRSYKRTCEFKPTF